jgi:uncharacterized RDD family membrane protein YckC
MNQRRKIAPAHRVAAKMVDIVIIIALAVILPYPLGPLIAFAYSLLCDGLGWGGLRGQSLGKKVFGLRVVNIVRDEPAGVRDSMLRNAPVGVATFFAIIPFWGWLILGLVGLPLMIMEIYLMVSVESGHRLGDVMADTEVREAPNPLLRGSREPTL